MPILSNLGVRRVPLAINQLRKHRRLMFVFMLLYVSTLGVYIGIVETWMFVPPSHSHVFLDAMELNDSSVAVACKISLVESKSYGIPYLFTVVLRNTNVSRSLLRVSLTVHSDSPKMSATIDNLRGYSDDLGKYDLLATPETFVLSEFESVETSEKKLFNDIVFIDGTQLRSNNQFITFDVSVRLSESERVRSYTVKVPTEKEIKWSIAVGWMKVLYYDRF